MENQVSLHEGQAWVSKIETFQMGTDFRGEALKLWRVRKISWSTRSVFPEEVETRGIAAAVEVLSETCRLMWVLTFRRCFPGVCGVKPLFSGDWLQEITRLWGTS